jgi:hypothetical protein
MKKNPVYESMTKLYLFGCTARIWRTEYKLGQSNNRDLLKWALTLTPKDMKMKRLLKSIAKFPRVCAVEIIDEDGQGCLFYPDWH